MPVESVEQIVAYEGRHLRVLGPPGSGKTSLLVERFRHLVSTGMQVVVVTFSRQHQDYLVRELLADGVASFGRLPAFTHARIASQIMEKARPRGHRPLRDIDELVVLRHVLENGNLRLESDYRTVLTSEDFRKVLLETIHTMMQNGVSKAAAAAAVTRTADARARDVFDLYAAFCQTLDNSGLFTFYDISWRAADMVERYPEFHPFPGADAVLVDDFQDLDPGQFRLIETLVPPQGDCGLNVFGDSTGARFGFRGTSDRFLFDVFKKRYEGRSFELHSPLANHPMLGPTCEILARSWRQHDQAAKRHDDSLKDLPLFDDSIPDDSNGVAKLQVAPATTVEVTAQTAKDLIAEAGMIATKIEALLTAGEVTADDVVVIAREPALYEAVLSYVFRDRGIPFDSGVSGTFSFDAFIDTLLVLVAGDSPGAYESLRMSPFWSDLCRCVEVESDPSVRGEVQARAAVARVRSLTRAGKRSTYSMEKLVERVLDPIIAKVATDFPISVLERVRALTGEWDSYCQTAGHLGESGDLGEFRRLMTRGRDPRRPGTRPGCVRLLSAREATGTGYPVVFAVGCAQGIFPATSSREGYVPYSALESALALSENEINFYSAASAAEKTREEYSLLLATFARARRLLSVSAPSVVGGATIRAWDASLAPLFGEDPVDVDRAGGIDLGVVREVVRSDSSSPNDFLGLMEAEKLWLTPAAPVRAFSVERFPMSPSRLGSYVKCPRLLFFTRIMGIKEESSIYLTIGSLFHSLAERIGRELETGRRLQQELGDDVVANMVEEVVAQTQELGPPGSLMESLSRYHLDRMIRSMMVLERQRTGDYRIGAAEDAKQFEYGGQSFLGKVDRVDEADRGRIVIDYKTGKMLKTGKHIKKHMLGESGGGTDRHWQIPIYSHAVKNETGELPAAFCYYVIQPDEDAFAAGLFVSDDPERKKSVKYFKDRVQGSFDSIEPAALTALMDEATQLTAEIFASRSGFARTENRKDCERCYFNRVCERRK